MKRFRFFGLALFLLLSFQSRAQFYAGADIDFDVIMSNSPFNNGSTGWGPGLAVGYRWGSVSPEVFFKMANTDQRYSGAEGEYDVDIESQIFGFGGRFAITPNVSSKLGFAFHNVEAEYTPLEGGALKSTIDGTKFGPYFGGGGKFLLFQGMEFFSDLNFYMDSAEYSLFTMEFGVRYLFL